MNGISYQFFLNALAGVMLVIAFYMTARMRLRSMLSMFAIQSFLLAIFAAVAAVMVDDWRLFITAALIFLLKTLFLPWFLVHTAERAGSTHRMDAFLRPAMTLFAAAALVLCTFIMTHSFVSFTHAQYLIVASSVSMVMMGLLMLVSRKGMYGQITGFLLMENGVFTFGLTLTGGMPLLVELGIFFDVVVGAVLMVALSYRVQHEHKTVATDTLTELVD